MNLTIALDPWCRIHPDDVTRDTPATLVRGVRQMSPTVSGIPNAPRFAFECRPARVVSVERYEDPPHVGEIWRVVVRDEGPGERGGLEWMLDTFPDSLPGVPAVDERPYDRSPEQWSVVVGELPVPRLRRLAIVIDPGTWKHWRKFGVNPQSWTTDRNTDVIFVTNESAARAQVFDEMRVMGKPDAGLVAAVRASVKPWF